MQGFRKTSEAAQRQAERREREDKAPRLTAEVPELASLKLEISEQSTVSTPNQPKHIKRVVVEHAPALFLIPCGDPACVDGGHDVTGPVMAALRRRETKFSGSDPCRGTLGSTICSRTMFYEGVAEYRGK
jgi:hypothetical protein